MENASKALLIAGTVLLAMLIVSIGVILYNNFSNTSDQYSERLSATELAKFNAEFEVFRGRTDVTAQEIATLVNMVSEYTKETPMSVKIEVNGIIFGEDADTITFLKSNFKKIYTCQNIEYNSAGEVNKIVLQES